MLNLYPNNLITLIVMLKTLLQCCIVIVMQKAHYCCCYPAVGTDILIGQFFSWLTKHVKTTFTLHSFHCHINYAFGSHVDLTGIICVNKMQEIKHGQLAFIESGSICRSNASRSYLEFYIRK